MKLVTCLYEHKHIEDHTEMKVFDENPGVFSVQHLLVFYCAGTAIKPLRGLLDRARGILNYG